ncbi:GARP complex subunit Vps53 [Phakopsora pachyrhizi]|uniref:GARP complex subunit Vps53 n=1 Tax=Phakopsora pachyrhizi TaxID=170000 RepID=A0AAV0BHU3_PHAPC|nr:GARP complex subunit Vps53 [Phakopsora pachyrhizi]
MQSMSFVLMPKSINNDTRFAFLVEEASVENLPLLQILLRQRILECNQKITLLKSQLDYNCEENGLGESRVEAIQEGIGALLTNLSNIRSSSTETQAVVESITREIRTLDLAKVNIESAVVGLKRFGMLVNAFDQLTRLVKARKYRETANSLQAIQQLAAQLSQLSVSVPRVSALFKELKDIQGLLRRTIMDDFSKAFEERSVVGSKAELADSCLVIDALGDDARDSLIEWYTSFQLREYRRIFSGPSSEAGQLDNISRRYAWFRRMLKSHEEDPSGGGNLFPENWKVGVRLCAQFGEATREDLKSVLAKSGSSLKVDLLLESLQITSMFEREMSQKFGTTYESIAAKSKSANVGAAIPIRTAFEPFLGIFVNAQDSTLSDMFQSFRSSRPKASDFAKVSLDDSPAAIIPSSMELFHFYRSTLDKCASLSNKSPFLNLCEVYKKWLKTYSEDILAATLSSLANSNNLGSSERSSSEFGLGPAEGSRLVRLPIILCACAVLNTAEYCAETSRQLHTKLEESIDKTLKSKVTLEREKDLFRGNISQAILTLLKELEHSCDGGFTAMIRAPWKELEYVSTESQYILHLNGAITAVFDLLKIHVEQKKYLRSICDKAVGILVNKFTQSIIRSRPIPAIGAEQMILDLQALKACLLPLPQLDPETPIPSSYTRYLSKSISKLDTLLKVIMTPEDPAEDFVKHYLLLIPCQSFSDFQKVLDLKGVRKQDQNTLLDVFLAMTSSQPDLTDSSFLSALDMNPDTPASTSKAGSLLQFSGLSRDPSSIGIGGDAAGPQSNSQSPEQTESGGSRALSDFKRIGKRIGIGLRFSRDA